PCPTPRCFALLPADPAVAADASPLHGMPSGVTPLAPAGSPTPPPPAAGCAAAPLPVPATPVSPPPCVVMYCNRLPGNTILPQPPNAEGGAGGPVTPVPRFLSLKGGAGRAQPVAQGPAGQGRPGAGSRG